MTPTFWPTVANPRVKSKDFSATVTKTEKGSVLLAKNCKTHRRQTFLIIYS